MSRFGRNGYGGDVAGRGFGCHAMMSNPRGGADGCRDGPGSPRRHLFQQPTEAGEPLVNPHDLQHRPERGLIAGDDGLANRALPVSDERYRWKIAAGNDEDLNLPPVDPCNGIARHAMSVHRVGHRIGAGKALARYDLQPIFDGVVTFQPFERGDREGHHQGNPPRAQGAHRQAMALAEVIAGTPAA